MCFQLQNQQFHHILKMIKTNPDPVLLFEVFALLEYWNPSTIKFDKAKVLMSNGCPIALCSKFHFTNCEFPKGKKNAETLKKLLSTLAVSNTSDCL